MEIGWPARGIWQDRQNESALTNLHFVAYYCPAASFLMRADCDKTAGICWPFSSKLGQTYLTS